MTDPTGSNSSERGSSTLVLYYLASGLWMVAGLATMATRGRDGSFWFPYFCVTMGMLFFTLARRRRRREEQAGR